MLFAVKVVDFRCLDLHVPELCRPQRNQPTYAKPTQPKKFLLLVHQLGAYSFTLQHVCILIRHLPRLYRHGRKRSARLLRQSHRNIGWTRYPLLRKTSSRPTRHSAKETSLRQIHGWTSAPCLTLRCSLTSLGKHRGADLSSRDRLPRRYVCCW